MLKVKHVNYNCVLKTTICCLIIQISDTILEKRNFYVGKAETPTHTHTHTHPHIHTHTHTHTHTHLHTRTHLYKKILDGTHTHLHSHTRKKYILVLIILIKLAKANSSILNQPFLQQRLYLLATSLVT